MKQWRNQAGVRVDSMREKRSAAKGMYAASMVIFGTLGLFTRHIPVSSGELALYRAVLAFLLVGLFLAVSRQKLDWKDAKREIGLLLVSGAAMGVNWILLFEAYRYTTISLATLSYYFAPVLVTAVSPFLFHERPGRRQIFCFAMSTAGLVLIVGSGGLEGGSTAGIFFGLCAAVFYASVILLNKRIRGVPGLFRTLLQFLAAALVLLPYVLCTGGIRLGEMDGTGWACLLLVGLFHTGVTYCMYFSSLKELTGQEASILSYLDPLTAVFISVALLGESMSPGQVLGGTLILGFTFWNERKSS